jgi:Uma2 family endonuclease
MKRATLRVMDTPVYTVKEYVDLEEYSNVKHEYFEGEIRAMAGGSNRHAQLGAAVIAQLGARLEEGPCVVYSSDLRVRIGDVITYPDASVVCGDVEMDAEDPDAHLNPRLLIEVTSPSTEKYDRGPKLERYKLVPTLRECVIVSHRAELVDVFTRSDDGTWAEPVTYGPGERIVLASVGCELDVDRLYRRRR